MKVGTHKKLVITLWFVLIASVSFGGYKNFIAIYQHTTHEKDVLELINGGYLYSELINPVFTQDGENVKLSLSVKFLDNQTKATDFTV